MMTDWLISTLQTIPALLWMVLGLGLPYALIALPLRDWRQTPLLAAVTLAFGPALLTAWMFVLGTLGMDDHPNPGATANPMQTIVPDHTGGTIMLTSANILAGTVLIALIGWLIVWRKWRVNRRGGILADRADMRKTSTLFWDERLLIALIVLATVGRWFMTSILSFGSWDPLWVYGYQGKLYTLIGYIPADIGYYPQFVSLQYAYTQIMTGGVDDHAARAIMPLLQIGSILAAYALGRLNFSRRVGIFAAAMWALYPHFGYWTRIGDLEIPMTFTFTLAAAFFIAAWHSDEATIRIRYAVIAGLSLGIALWTKPTAGALVWGVVLVVVAGLYPLIPKSLLPRRGEGTSDLLSKEVAQFSSVSSQNSTLPSPLVGEGPGVRGRILGYLRSPHFQAAFLMGIATIPLGGLWYARNIALGHAAIVFPPDYWTGEASRGGAEFGWPLLALVVLLAYAYLAPTLSKRPDWRLVIPGGLLIAAGVLPTILDPRGFFGPHRMGMLEWAALGAGSSLVAFALWRWRSALDASRHADVRKLAVAGLLALPYFVTWFISYSYHYRLSFAIVPLMILPAAVVLGRWWLAEPVFRLRDIRLPGVVYGVALLLVGLPGVVTTAYDEFYGWDYVDTLLDPPPGEGVVESVARALRDWQADHDEPLHVIAPGFQRLPFTLPLKRVYVAEMPRTYAEVEGATHFIDGSDAIFVYGASGELAPYQNQLLVGLQRPDLVTEVGTFEDASFFYEVRELHLDRRFDEPGFATPADQSTGIGNCARLHGHSLDAEQIAPGAQVPLRLVWASDAQCSADYSIYVHLYADDGSGERFLTSIGDGPVQVDGRGYYSTLFWDPGEYVLDERILSLSAELPAEETLRVRIGFYDVVSGERAPVTVNGEPAGDGFTLLEIER